MALLVFGAAAFAMQPAASVEAATGTNTQMNYQGRLLSAGGAIVADGTYNMQFKVYYNGDGTVAGNTAGSPAGTLAWTESWQVSNGQGVTVRNGYYSVQLGSINSLSGIDFNQDTMYLSMNVGGTANTASPTYDGEMLPMKRLAASPYAQNAAKLGGISAASFLQLAQGVQNDASTANASLFINKTAATANIVDIQRGGADVLLVNNAGQTLFRPTVDSQTALSVQKAGTTTTVFTVDSTNARIGIGTGAPAYAVDAVGSVNASTDLRVAGTTVCTSSGCTPAAGSNNYLRNTTTAQSANFYVQSAAAGSVAGVVQGAASQSVDIFQVKTSGGNNSLQVMSDGTVDVNSPAIGLVPLVVAGATGQTADLLQVKSSVGGTTVSKIDASGNLTVLSAYTNGLTSSTLGGANDLTFTANPVTSNLIVANPGMEGTTLTWAANGTGVTAPSAVTTYARNGAKSLSVVTSASATANAGVKYPVTMTSGTSYSLNFYARTASGSFNTLVAGRADNGSTNTVCSLSATTINAYWSFYSCTFTAGAQSGTPYIFIGQSDAGVAHTYYIDDVQLLTAANSAQATATRAGNVQVQGAITSTILQQNTNDSSNAFQVLNAAGTSIMNVDTANNFLTVNGTIQAAASFTNNIYVINSGLVGSNNGTGSVIQINQSGNNNGAVRVLSRESGSIAQIIQGVSGQVADLLQVQNSTGTVMAKINSGGSLTAANLTSNDTLTVVNGSTLSGSVGVGMAPGSYRLNVLGANASIAQFSSPANNNGYTDINATSTGYRVGFNLQDAGTTKWQFGKQTDNSFFLYDATNDIIPLKVTTAGNVALSDGAGRTGVGTSSPGAKLHVVSIATNIPSMIVQGAASQSADLMQLQNSAGSSVFSVNTGGYLTSSAGASFGGATTVNDWFKASDVYTNNLERGSGNGSRIMIADEGMTVFSRNSSQTTNNTLMIKAIVSQTGDLLQFQNSSGTSLGGFNASGQRYMASGSYTGTIVQGSLGANRTYTLPDASGTICLTTTCSGGSSGINNSTTLQSANIAIQSNGAAADHTIRVRAASGQTGSIFRVEDTAGNYKFQVDITGNVLAPSITLDGANTSASSSSMYINGPANGTAALAVYRAGSGSTADLLQVRNSSDTTLAGFSNGGSLYFKKGSNFSNLNSLALTANRTINLPDADGTICLTTTCGGGGNGYIVNGTTVQTANFSIQSSSTSAVTAKITAISSQSSDLLQLIDSGGTARFKVNAAGNITASSITTGPSTFNAGDSANAITGVSATGNGAYLQGSYGIIATGSQTSGLFQTNASNNGYPTLIVKAGNAQSGDLFQALNNSGGNLAWISNNGSVSTFGTLSAGAAAGSTTAQLAVQAGSTSTTTATFQGASGGSSGNILEVSDGQFGRKLLLVNDPQKAVSIDGSDVNYGGFDYGLRFGAPNSGEGITSTRTSGAEQYSLNLWTGNNKRIAITAGGNVCVNLVNCSARFTVQAASSDGQDLARLQNTDGNGISVNNNGNFTSNAGNYLWNSNANGIPALTVQNYGSNTVASLIKAASNQSADILQIQDSSNTNKLRFTSAYSLRVAGSVVSNTTPDIAETIPAAADVTTADVVMADPNNTERVVKAVGGYNTTAVGVIADGTSGFIINSRAHAAEDGLNGKPLTLAGRVQVKISGENGAVKPGDYLTTSNTLPGYAMKATAAGATIGKSLGFFDPATQGQKATVLVFVNLSYYNPTTGAAIQGQDAGFANMLISGTATIAKLEVTGMAHFAGDLVVDGILKARDIELAGHLKATGTAPTTTTGTGSCGGTVTVTGADTAGTITVTTGASVAACTAAELAKVTFAQAYDQLPTVIVAPANKVSGSVAAFFDADASTAASWSLAATNALSPNTTYKFTYHVVQ